MFVYSLTPLPAKRMGVDKGTGGGIAPGEYHSSMSVLLRYHNYMSVLLRSSKLLCQCVVTVKGTMYPVMVELVELMDEASMSLLWSFDGMEDTTMVSKHA